MLVLLLQDIRETGCELPVSDQEQAEVR